MTDDQEKLEKMKKLYSERYDKLLRDSYEEAILYGTGPLADVLGMNISAKQNYYGKGIVEELLGENKND